MDERFRAVGVTSPNGRLWVGLAWLYHESSNYMETLRRAIQEMADEDGLREIFAAMEDNIDSVIHYAQAVRPEVHEIFEEH
ncbi:MAG: hypothetical protein WD379_00695 [Dehalococcoidia bacterium]